METPASATTDAANVADVPMKRLGELVVRETERTAAATVIADDALRTVSATETAVMVVLPREIAVTTPVCETLATELLPDLQMTAVLTPGSTFMVTVMAF